MNSYTSDSEWTIGRTARLGLLTYKIGEKEFTWPVYAELLQAIVADLLTWEPRATHAESAVVMVLVSRDLSPLTELAAKYAKGGDQPAPVIEVAHPAVRGVLLGGGVAGHAIRRVTDAVPEPATPSNQCHLCGATDGPTVTLGIVLTPNGLAVRACRTCRDAHRALNDPPEGLLQRPRSPRLYANPPRIECLNCDEPATVFYKSSGTPLAYCDACHEGDPWLGSQQCELLFDENMVGQTYIVEDVIQDPEMIDDQCCDMCEVSLSRGHPYIDRATNIRFIVCLGCAGRVTTNVSVNHVNNRWIMTRMATLAEGAEEWLAEAAAPLEYDPAAPFPSRDQAEVRNPRWIIFTNIRRGSTISVYHADYSTMTYRREVGEHTTHRHEYSWADYNRPVQFVIEHPDYFANSYDMEELDNNQARRAAQIPLTNPT